MNSFPIGLNITEINEENLLCKKKHLIFTLKKEY